MLPSDPTRPPSPPDPLLASRPRPHTLSPLSRRRLSRRFRTRELPQAHTRLVRTATEVSATVAFGGTLWLRSRSPRSRLL